MARFLSICWKENIIAKTLSVANYWRSYVRDTYIRGKTLSSHLKLESLKAAATALGASERVAACMSEPSTTSTIHHVEENVGVNVDAVHATHSSHATHTTKR